MGIRTLALALNELDKAASGCQNLSLQAALKRHIQRMTRLLMNEQIVANQARNFRLETPTQIPLTLNSYLHQNHHH